MGKNDKYKKDTVIPETNTEANTPELTTVIGEDGMADMTVASNENTFTEEQIDTPVNSDENTDSTIDDATDLPKDGTTDAEGDGTIIPSAPESQEPTKVEEQKEDVKDGVLQDESKLVVEDLPKQEDVKVSLGNDIKVLNDSSVSIEDKIIWCLTDAPSIVKNIAIQLESYNMAMRPSAPHDESTMVNKQYDLVSIFRNIFNTTEYKDFKIKFDVLNLFFVHYRQEAFASQRLVRFDYLWKWSDVELTTLQNMARIVTQLCVYPERAKGLKQINFDLALDSTKTIVSEAARNNILKYYGK